MASRTGDLDRLSGVELPLILQKKLKSQKQASGQESKNQTTEDDENADTVFTAEELEERVLKARTAISDIQKQLLIGEESYHEETNSHGNLFRGGWELFIDVKDSAPSGHKRMPADYRWFSGSCVNTAGRNQGHTMSMKSLSSLPPAKKAAPIARSASQVSIPSAASSVSQGGSGDAVSGGRKGNIEVEGTESIAQGASATEAMVRAANARSTQLAGANGSSAQDAASSQGKNPSNESMKNADPASTTAPAAVPPPKEVSAGRKARKRKSSE